MAKRFQVDTGGTLTTSLVSYWNMEGSSTDYYGSNNGTDTAVTYGSSYGKIGQGALFNGTTSKILIANATAYSTVSVSLWFNTSAGGNMTLFNLNNSGQTQDLEVTLQSGKLVFDTWNGTTSYAVTSAGTYNNGAWHHVVAIKNGTTLSAYVDNVSVGSTAQTAFSVGGTEWSIGVQYYNNNAFLNGDLNEIGLWSKALSAQEITDLYNAGAGDPLLNPEIGYVSSATAYTTSTNPVTASITATGSNLVALAAVFSNGFAVSSVTYGGVAMTQITSTTLYTQGPCYLYYLPNPPTGTQNVVATMTGNGQFDLAVAVYSGASQNASPDSFASYAPSGGVTNLSCNTTTVLNNSWLVSFLCDTYTGTGLGAGTNTTIRQNVTGFATRFVCGDSNGPMSPAGSYTQAYTTFGSSVPAAMFTVSIARVGVTTTQSIAVTATGVVSLSKHFVKVVSIAVTATGVMTMTMVKTFARTISVTATGVVSLLTTLIQKWKLEAKNMVTFTDENKII